MKNLKKLQKAKKKERKARTNYIKAKVETYTTAENLKKEYYSEDNQRSEALMLLQEFGLTDDFTEEEQEECKVEHLTLPKRD
jgi:hypothetical protein